VDGLTRHIKDEIPWYMSFVDDIVLVNETRYAKSVGGEKL